MAGKRRTPTQQRSQEMVQDILEAAARVFDAEGIDATTNRIAERAGVSIGSLYQYFADKQALLHELALRHLDEVEHTFAEAARAHTPDDLVEHLVHVAADLHRPSGGLHRMMREHAPRSPELVARFTEVIDRVTAGMAQVLTEAGVADPRTRARSIVATVDAQVHTVLTEDVDEQTRQQRIALVVTQVRSVLDAGSEPDTEPARAADQGERRLVPEELLSAWRAEHTGPALGWDFSALAGRLEESDVPWDLDALYREHLARAGAVLDMGTGGGEHLLRFADHLPADTIATEGWPPNLEVARRALEPRGIEVVSFGQPDDARAPEPMPFTDARFDLVLNRHESYHPLEIFRVLRPGGYFLTQQVDGTEFSEVRDAFGLGPIAPGVQYETMREALIDAGLEVVDGAEATGQYAFTEIAALVAYLRLVPWEAPEDFTVDTYAHVLAALHRRGPAQGRPLRATRIRFWMLARKP